MSIFASRTTQEIALPFDPPQTVVIQKLAGRHLEQAKQDNTFASVDNLKRMGGAAFQKELNALGDDDPDKKQKLVEEYQRDPLNSYDRYTVLRHGLVSWSYDVPVGPETIDDLDDEAAAFLAREILRLSKPSLFQTEDEVKADLKNAVSSSTAH